MRYKLILLFWILSFRPVLAQSVQDVFTQSELTWYGLDFSMSKFVGDFAQFNTAGSKAGDQIRDTYFKSWNNVILSEREKYNISEFYKKERVFYDLNNVDSLNAKVDTEKMMVWEAPKGFRLEDIQKMVNKYDKNGKSSIGLVFIIECFDKTLEKAAIHATFFDTKTGKVLLAKKIITSPRGIGLRNYWASTAFFTMEECKDNWKSWKKEAGIK